MVITMFTQLMESCGAATLRVVPLVSVVMSVFNGEDFLDEAVDSVLSQSFDDFEFLVCDDGSTDATWSILVDKAAEDPRLRPIRNSSNQGLTRALNALIAESVGLYVARMDADDISHRDRFRKQVAVFRDKPEVGVVFTSTRLVDTNGRFVCDSWRPESVDTILKRLPYINYIPHSSVMLKRSVFAELGLYDTTWRRSQDRELWMRFAEAGVSFYYLREPLLDFRKHRESVSNKERATQFDAYFYADLCLSQRQPARALRYLKKMTPGLRVKLLLKMLLPPGVRTRLTLLRRRQARG